MIDIMIDISIAAMYNSIIQLMIDISIVSLYNC